MNIAGFICATNAAAVVKPNHSRVSINNFSAGPHVKKQTHFWELVFAKYPSTSVLVHDQHDPQLLLDLIDYKKLSTKYGGKALYSRKHRDAITAKYIARYELGIKRFAEHKGAAAKFGPIEQRILDVYQRRTQSLDRLYRGEVTIRPQTGLSDEFIVAARRAYRYLPYMEQIFKDEGIPVDLTRLAFVESMFNIYAVSKVGASGIWQFMPDTAKEFMRVDSYFDERNSPLKATRGAAKLLRQNFKLLKSWPLAVTAYNHGPGSLKKAIKELGTDDFETIVRNYNAKSFGFASRNFYAEFLAARNVYNKYFHKLQAKSFVPHVIPIKLDQPVSLDELVNHTPLDRGLITEHNPCLLPRAYSKFQYQPLPAGYELFVPMHIAHGVRSSLNQLSTPKHRRS
jgi:membrane-bound lytic murein transglycosylase D